MNELPLSAECADLVEKILSYALRSQRTPVADGTRSFVNVEFNGRLCELGVLVVCDGVNPTSTYMSYPLCANEETTYKQVLDGLVQAYNDVRKVLNT